MASWLRLRSSTGSLALSVLGFCMVVYYFANPLSVSFLSRFQPYGRLEPLAKPNNISVNGIIFYGRKDRVSCLLCYIEVSPGEGSEARLFGIMPD